LIVLNNKDTKKALHKNEDYNIHVGADEKVAIAMITEVKKQCEAHAFFTEKKDPDIICLGILLGHAYHLQTIIKIFYSTKDKNIEKLLIRMKKKN